MASNHESAAGIVTKLSPWSVSETVTRLSAIVTARGMKLFAVVDHSGEARAVGLALRETQLVIFGSPEAGTPAMHAAPLAGLDLPQRVLVWLDDEQTKVSYVGPRVLTARYQLDADVAREFEGIGSITDAVIHL